MCWLNTVAYLASKHSALLRANSKNKYNYAEFLNTRVHDPKPYSENYIYFKLFREQIAHVAPVRLNGLSCNITRLLGRHREQDLIKTNTCKPLWNISKWKQVFWRSEYIEHTPTCEDCIEVLFIFEWNVD